MEHLSSTCVSPALGWDLGRLPEILRTAWPPGAQGLVKGPGNEHMRERSNNNQSLHEVFLRSLGNGFFRASLVAEAALSQTLKAEKWLTQSKGHRPSLSKGAEVGRSLCGQSRYLELYTHPQVRVSSRAQLAPPPASHLECPGSLEFPP